MEIRYVEYDAGTDRMTFMVRFVSGCLLGAVLFSPFGLTYAVMGEFVTENTRLQCGAVWLIGTIVFGICACLFGDAFWGALGALIRLIQWFPFFFGRR